MARKHHNGFEWGSVLDGTLLASATVTIDEASARSGGFGQHVTLTDTNRRGWYNRPLSANTASHWFLRIYLKLITALNGTSRIMLIGAGTDVSALCMGVVLNADRTLTLSDEDGVIGSSSALSLDTWYRIEVEFDNTTAAGSHVCRLRLDGTNVVEATNRSIATNPRGYAVGGHVYLGTATSGEFYIDDVALNDSSNSHENSWPGDGKIIILLPTGDGDTTNRGTQGTHWDTGPTTGQAAFAQVDEGATPDDGTSYITLLDTSASTTDPPIMLFNVENPGDKGIGASDTIKFVTVRLRHGSSAAQARRHRHLLKSGSSFIDGAMISCATSTPMAWDADSNTSPEFFTRIVQHTDPSTAVAWTRSGVDSVQVGFRSDSDVTPVPRISFVAAEVEYVPTAGGGAADWIPRRGSFGQDARLRRRGPTPKQLSSTLLKVA